MGAHRQVISSLVRTVEQLQETAVGRQEEGYDSPSSGVGSLTVRQEEGYDSPSSGVGSLKVNPTSCSRP